MVWIFGASGHGKVILDILKLNNIPVAGFIDDNESIHQFMDYKVIRQHELTEKEPAVILGIGDNAIRRKRSIAPCLLPCRDSSVGCHIKPYNHR
jgi:hypothetical protein